MKKEYTKLSEEGKYNNHFIREKDKVLDSRRDTVELVLKIVCIVVVITLCKLALV